MKIQIVSDLHLEFFPNRQWISENPLICRGDMLLMAGDIICDIYKKKARSFYSKISADFPFIISTMGNHEFYRGIINYAYPSYQSKLAENHLKLNNNTYIIDDIKFIVTTLWSYVPPEKSAIIKSRLNDYHYISRTNFYKEKYLISIQDTNRYHQQSINFLTRELAKPFDGNVVIMTHHIPSYMCISDEFKSSPLNPAYVTNLDDMIASHPQIKLWVCGHSHDFNYTCIGKTIVVRNPLGYVDYCQQRDFKRDFYVEI